MLTAPMYQLCNNERTNTCVRRRDAVEDGNVCTMSAEANLRATERQESREHSAPRVGRGPKPARPVAAVDTLTDRQLEVFRLIGDGLSTAQIANRLHISVHTIETHRENLKHKLNCDCARELARRAVLWVSQQH